MKRKVILNKAWKKIYSKDVMAHFAEDREGDTGELRGYTLGMSYKDEYPGDIVNGEWEWFSETLEGIRKKADELYEVMKKWDHTVHWYCPLPWCRRVYGHPGICYYHGSDNKTRLKPCASFIDVELKGRAYKLRKNQSIENYLKE